MKVLLCHNFYKLPGGEDQVFDAEGWLLRSRGHDVVTFTRHNDAVDKMSRLELARKTFWNRETYDELRELIRREKPDLMHCTNIFPLISPAAYDAARAESVPVIQSLHNYRLMCPGALLLRDGRVCEKCVDSRTFWPGVLHACYRGSYAASAVVAGMLSVHKARGTWADKVDRYIALTEFSRRKFIQAGLPEFKVDVKPNFIQGEPAPGEGRGDYVVYVGRLSPEKGIDTLLDAWSRLDQQIPLHIVGDGPMADRVAEAAQNNPTIRWLGGIPHDEVLDIVGDARFLVFPSKWHETFGLTVIEAFAKGTPVVVAWMGAMRELVDDGRTGLHFQAGDAAGLAAKAQQLWNDPNALIHMRKSARSEYEAKFTAERNYELLLDIYSRTLDQVAGAAESETVSPGAAIR